MGFSGLLQICWFLVFFLVFASSDLLVYKGCSKRSFQGNGAFEQNLNVLLQSLVSQSEATLFFKSTSGSGQNAILGLFQCRGDLSNGECYRCVSSIQSQVFELCGKTMAARVQLQGCYLQYDNPNYPEISSSNMLFKTCNNIQVSDDGFVQRREAVFADIESGLTNGHGFYKESYGGIYAFAQCEGDLGVADCGECVKNAINEVKRQCYDGISGGVYMPKCYVTYSYGSSGSRSGSPGTGFHLI
ncbi:cysteine-rich repeat secretory protein 3 [Amborella trichopoda]|uniref:Gnk2-homologous domain-containing protein n=1 Tax=Amborella trichopoda TaxID=13333 RepID=W1PLQ9_AMBTC|nr:cysteine-rich repeat secretory protein 3 [Amborella trichopoda]ERN08983.1 hypothetical protein AMTR_s00153p00041880 [Amborella trichopoda]|eukprot:XP_006847402.1 cysteine-rich repeat secretory protein 3 [Amborella trichopoda]